MHPLTQGIAHLEKTNDPVGESLDHGDLEPEPEVLHLGAERLAFIEQRLGPLRERMQALQERRRCTLLSKLLDRGTRGCERIARQIDAVEISVVLAAVL